jgi:AraC family transcriptional regulator
MNYFELINDAVNFIENNLARGFSLDELAGRYHVSRFYFHRIFRAVTNKTLKTYLDERRLSEAAQRLRNSQDSILDIALDFGFSSHEAFTRSFKRQFGIRPADYRRTPVGLKLAERIAVVERDFKNLNRDMVIDFSVESMPSLVLVGDMIAFNPDSPEDLMRATEFVQEMVECQITPDPHIERMFSVTMGKAGSAGEIIYFTGFLPGDGVDYPGLKTLEIPASKFAVFQYKGGMSDIFRTVLHDLCRFICVSGLWLNKMEVEFLEVYQRDYGETGVFSIYLPVL